MNNTVKWMMTAWLACCSWGNAVAQADGRDGYVDFLYQYMALPDVTDYSREYYCGQVDMALKARGQMPWGATVPEREFRHFVLPPRVNNETLDTCRSVFFAALQPRLQGLSMQDAILEVNHWCHERVAYRPTDARTSSPLATIRTAYGRCGEESTLLVAALRSVCIPARQVYTPRWAHTDDNHAWVEAWADGQWHFLGACEPEPVLDLGWFNESASRGMLMHTKVFGSYDGPEEVVTSTPCYTEINVTGNYAPTQTVTIRVTDEAGRPVGGALVEFKLYNYAEFYTVVKKTTDAHGCAALTAGRGDMLVWVSKDGLAALRKVTFDADKEVAMVLATRQPPLSMDLDMVPPKVSAVPPSVSDGQVAANTRRLACEDSMRRAYEQTMPVEAWRGNHAVISKYLQQTANPVMARQLLKVLSAKDLRDVSLEVLLDNDMAATDTTELFTRYVLCPRAENEWLTPYKAFLRRQMAGIASPRALEQWCCDSLDIMVNRNPQQLRMRPMSVFRHRKTDLLGRNIFFVCAARSLGFPARINPVDGQVEYFENGCWQAVFKQADEETSADKARLLLKYKPVEYFDDPKYYTHFTLSRIDSGRAQLLTYPEEATWKNDFADGVELEAGDYLLTTGTRLASGRVKARIDPIHLQAPSTLARFTMREDSTEPQVIGSLNAEDLFTPISVSPSVQKHEATSLLATTGRGYYIIGVVAPNQEPTNHALRDIAAVGRQLEQWGRKMVLLLPSAEDAGRFNFSEFQGLPSTVVWGIDSTGAILDEMLREMKLGSRQLPVFMVCDTFNRVVFVQQGYTIHLGEQLLKVVKSVQGDGAAYAASAGPR